MIDERAVRFWFLLTPEERRDSPMRPPVAAMKRLGVTPPPVAEKDAHGKE